MSAQIVEYLIVGAIVAGSAWYAGAKYLPKSWRRKLGQKQQASGCGSGCGSSSGCGSCETAQPVPPPDGKHRVITLHKA